MLKQRSFIVFMMVLLSMASVTLMSCSNTPSSPVAPTQAVEPAAVEAKATDKPAPVEEEAVTDEKKLKKLVAVFSYEVDYWSQMHENEGLMRALNEQGWIEGKNIEITRIYMDIKTVNKTVEQKQALVPTILAQIEAVDPDIIFTVEDDALIYIGSHFLDTDIPVVFAGVNSFPDHADYSAAGALVDSLETPGHNITGVLERVALKAGFELMRQIMPDAQKAVFISDDSSLTHLLMDGGGGEEELKQSPIEIVDTILTNDYDTLKKAVLDYQDKVDLVVLFTPFSIADADGVYIPQQDIISWFVQNSKRPSIGYLDVLVEEGLMAGAVVDLKEQGYHAGLMIHRIFEGENPANMPVIDPVANRILINLARANQLGIDIPFEVIKSADIVYNTMTVYPEYKMSK